MLSFVIAEEDLWIETSNPFNEVTAVFLLNNPRYHIPMYVRTYVCMHVAIWRGHLNMDLQVSLLNTSIHT